MKSVKTFVLNWRQSPINPLLAQAFMRLMLGLSAAFLHQIACAGVTQCHAAFASGASLPLGSYQPLLGVRSDTAHDIAITCTVDAPGNYLVSVRVAGGASSNPIVRTAPRVGISPVGLAYRLFLDPLHTVLWGDGTAGTQVASVTLSETVAGQAVGRLTVYSEVMPRQDVMAGQYLDFLSVTVDY